MAYSSNGVLPFEHASKLGHVTIINDPFINDLIDSFQDANFNNLNTEISNIATIQDDIPTVSNTISIDGSYASIENLQNKKKSLSYIKVASLYLSQKKLNEANEPIVDPEVISEIISKNSDVFSTVLPLNNVVVKKHSPLESLRIIVEKSFYAYEDGMLYDTLRYLIFRKWNKSSFKPLVFGCPFCNEEIIIDSDQEKYNCKNCKRTLFLTDYLGLHMEINDDNTSESVAVSLMQLIEHLTLFSYIRVLFENSPEKLSEVLFIKDGPLALYSQYSRLIPSMRDMISFISENHKLYIVGVEKSGVFFEHSEIVNMKLKNIGEYFIPDNKYIFSNIKHGDPQITLYGERVIYGSKVYLKFDEHETALFSIPTTHFTAYPQKDDFLYLETVLKTLIGLKSRQYTNAILPIVAVNKIASMAMYPSNKILSRFTENIMMKEKFHEQNE